MECGLADNVIFCKGNKFNYLLHSVLSFTLPYFKERFLSTHQQPAVTFAPLSAIQLWNSLPPSIRCNYYQHTITT